MLIDSFIFYNELDLLEYRFGLLYDHVDYFILVESTQTHSGKVKPLYFQENRDRYVQYLDRVIHVVVDNFTEMEQIQTTEYRGDALRREIYQRNAIIKGLQQLKIRGDDLIMMMDVDEIPNPVRVKSCNIHEISKIEMDFYYYNLECKGSKWSLPIIFSYKHLENYIKRSEPGPNGVRGIHDLRIHSYIESVIRNGGWHLSYFGNIEFIKNKIKAFSHQEYNNDTYLDDKKIQQQIDGCGDLFFRHNETTHNFKRVHLFDNEYLPPHYQLLIPDKPLTIWYGAFNNPTEKGTYINVTGQCSSLFKNDKQLHFPKEKLFNNWFGDPCLGVLKKLVIEIGKKHTIIDENCSEPIVVEL